MNPVFSVLVLPIVVAAGCGGSGPKPADPRDVQGPDDLGGATVTPPNIPGVAYIDMRCEPKKVDCNGYPFGLHVVGDDLDTCRITPDAAKPGTEKVSVQIDNKTDPSVGILVSFDGYTGTGRYQLDDKHDRHVEVAKSLTVPSWEQPDGTTCYRGGSWTGPPTTSTHSVDAPVGTCGACEVQVTERNPGVSPRVIELHVTCESMCVNNDDVVCRAPSPGPSFIEFDYTAECTN
jgi:hypothetical protein